MWRIRQLVWLPWASVVPPSTAAGDTYVPAVNKFSTRPPPSVTIRPYWVPQLD